MKLKPAVPCFSVIRPLPLLLLFLLTPLLLMGVAGTSQVAWQGKPVAPRDGWPRDALTLINDPLRRDGWNPWFSELPNAVDYYEMQIRNMEDVNHLLAQLAKIDAPRLELFLDPREQAGYLGFATEVKREKQVGAVFAIGDQEQLDQWLKAKKEMEQPEIGSELHTRASDAPRESTVAALPPTLTLYVGHPAVDLQKLRCPSNVQLLSGVPDWYRKAHPDDATVALIDKFIVAKSSNSSPAPLKIPDLSQKERGELVLEAQQAFTRFVRTDPTKRGHNIPEEFWGPTISRFKPIRLVDDRVNIKIVLAEADGMEAGFYVQLAISSYIRPREEFLEFVPLNTNDDSMMGEIFRYKAKIPDTKPN